MSFTIENWLSYRDRTTFSMVATDEENHRERVPYVKEIDARILPVAALYGGNASGKSNLFKALRFMKEFVTRETRKDAQIPVRPYRLSQECKNKPSFFSVEFISEGTMYEYSFEVDSKTVLKEKLVKITNDDEIELFERIEGELVTLDEELNDLEFLKYAFKGTRPNQLYVNNVLSQGNDAFKDVDSWFQERLVLIFPDFHLQALTGLVDPDHHLYKKIYTFLSELDTGVKRLRMEDLYGEQNPFGEKHLNALVQRMRQNESALPADSEEGTVQIVEKNGQVQAQELVTFHGHSEEAPFQFHEESDGTQRVIEFLPAFADISSENSEKVILIDEIDRSLHTLLTRNLLDKFLCSCKASTRAQLLFTTHDLLLMDRDLFRVDEMWVAERDADGTSKIFSLSDYEGASEEKNIRNRYLEGRFGGIPRFLFEGPAIDTRDDVESSS